MTGPASPKWSPYKKRTSAVFQLPLIFSWYLRLFAAQGDWLSGVTEEPSSDWKRAESLKQPPVPGAQCVMLRSVHAGASPRDREHRLGVPEL